MHSGGLELALVLLLAAVIAVPHGVYPPAQDALDNASLVVSDLRELTAEAVDRLR